MMDVPRFALEDPDIVVAVQSEHHGPHYQWNATPILLLVP